MKKKIGVLLLGGNPKRIAGVVALLKNKNINITLSVLSVSKNEERRYRKDQKLWNFLRSKGVVVDNSAFDTLSNFTTTLKYFYGFDELFVVTDQCQIKRAMSIANIVYGKRNIELKRRVVVVDGCKPEGPLKIRKDILQAKLWKWTGYHYKNREVRNRIKNRGE